MYPHERDFKLRVLVGFGIDTDINIENKITGIQLNTISEYKID